MTPQAPDVLLQQVLSAALVPNPPARLAVAVSGGSDSMALLRLAVDCASNMGWAAEAVTVNHALRDGAAAEAAFVAQTCADLGVPHQVLVWDHGAISGNVQDQARRARYRLMADWAQGAGIGHVLLGHTADDQAETFLMGLSRTAGLDGLSGMRPGWQAGTVQFLRPLLGVGRADLRAYLNRLGQVWVDDPSNQDPAYDRIKARRAMAALRPLGITAQKIGQVVGHLTTARQALDQITRTAVNLVFREQGGAIGVNVPAFARQHPEVQRRLVIAALHWLTGADYPPRAASVGRMMQAILDLRGVTLAGCKLRHAASGPLILREPKAVARLSCGTQMAWDGRWRLDGPHAPDLAIRALGAAGLKGCPAWRDSGFSRDILLVTPAIWRGDVLVAAPLAGKPAGWTATVAAGFGLFAISH